MSQLGACLDLMQRGDIDVLMLGREANARAVASVSRLWLAGTRTFSPGCVVVRREGTVHVLANTDAVVPSGFPITRLYGLTWNPEKLLAELTAIDGVGEARRVAVDGMNPLAAALLARAMPDAEVVDAGPLFAALWTSPDDEKSAGVVRATEVAALGLATMAEMLQPGAQPRELRGACAQAFASEGVTTPAFEAVAAPLSDASSTWMPTERAFVEGEPVVLRAGALCDGWEGSLARTYAVGAPAIEQAPPSRWDALVEACVPGTEVGALRARGAVVYGVGHGVEPWSDDFPLAAGLMVSIELRDDTTLRQDVLRVDA